jgi:hypothetical protein
MAMTAQQAQFAAIEFIDCAVEHSVRMMLTTNGMKGDDQCREVRPVDEVGATVNVVVHYGDKLQRKVQGEARLTGFDQGWTDATLTLTGDALWHIVARNLGGRRINWTVEEKK